MGNSYEGADKMPCLVVPQSIRERLEDQKKSLEMQLANVTSAIALLTENPVFEKIHDAISKTRIGLY